jgi:outer membrane protein assembly factor BamB
MWVVVLNAAVLQAIDLHGNKITEATSTPAAAGRIWKYDAGGAIQARGSLFGTDGIVLGSDDAYVRGMSASNGNLLWSYKTGGPVQGDPFTSTSSEADAPLFVGSMDKHLYALHPATGALVWKTSAAKGPIVAAAAMEQPQWIRNMNAWTADTPAYSTDATQRCTFRTLATNKVCTDTESILAGRSWATHITWAEAEEACRANSACKALAWHAKGTPERELHPASMTFADGGYFKMCVANHVDGSLKTETDNGWNVINCQAYGAQTATRSSAMDGFSTLTHILDSDATTYWESQSNGPQWITFDMAADFEVDGLKLLAPDDGHSPKSFSLLTGATRAGPWVKVANFTAQQSSTMQYFPFKGSWATGASRYWRVEIMSTHSHSPAYASPLTSQIKEIGFHGVSRASTRVVHYASEEGDVYGVYSVDGSSKWPAGPTDVVGHVRAGPLVHNGVLFVGSFDESGTGGGNGWLTALDATDGSLKWTYEAGKGVQTTPAVVRAADGGESAEDFVVFGSLDGGLHAVGTDGVLKWKTSLDGVPSSAVVTEDGYIFVATSFAANGRDKLLKVNPADGSAVGAWATSGEFGLGGPVTTAPALSADELTVVVASWGGRQGVIPTDGTEASTTTPALSLNARSTGMGADWSGLLATYATACSGTKCPTRVTVDSEEMGGDYTRFDGVDDFLTLGTTASMGIVDSSFTAMAWVKAGGPGSRWTRTNSVFGTTPQAGSSATGTSSSKGLGMVIGPSYMRMGFEGAGTSDCTATTAVPSGRWVHVAFVYDKSKRLQTLYYDGVEKARCTDRAPFMGAGAVLLGKSSSADGFMGGMKGAVIEDGQAFTKTQVMTASNSHRPDGSIGGERYRERANMDQLGGMVGAQPTAALSHSDGSPHIGAPDDYFNVNGHQAKGAFLVAVHTGTGNLRWRHKMQGSGSKLNSAPTIRASDGMVFAGSDTGTMEAVLPHSSCHGFVQGAFTSACQY